ncbi:MAG: hypothetical protein ACT4P3_09480 [Betaproteobacteria bacterium]
MKLEVHDWEGKRYSSATIRGDDGEPLFVGLMDWSPNRHFGLLIGNRLADGGAAALFFIDQQNLWARPVVKPDFPHVTDHGVAAFVDAGQLVIADMKGVILDKPFGPPCCIDAFEVGADSFYITADRTRWRADYDGNLTRLK